MPPPRGLEVDRFEVRPDKLGEARAQQLDEPLDGSLGHHDPPHLRADPFAADHQDAGRVLADRLERPRVFAESQHRGEADRPQHPQLVLVEPLLRVTDRSQDPPLQVGLAVHVVDHLVGSGVVKQAVDRKITSKRVVHGVAVVDRVGTASVGVISVAPERRHLGRLTLRGRGLVILPAASRW